MSFMVLLHSCTYSPRGELGSLAEAGSYSVLPAPVPGRQPGDTELLADLSLVPCRTLWGLASSILGDSQVGLAPERSSHRDRRGDGRGAEDEWRGEV